MNELQQRMKAFLDDTVEYYSADPIGRRSRNTADFNGSCKYDPAKAGKADTSEGCAIGRHMTPEQKAVADHNKGVGSSSVNELPVHLIPEKLRDMPIEFLRRVQSLHDSDHHWDANGLSSLGRSVLLRIRQDFDLL
jgi:hypothetical protein